MISIKWELVSLPTPIESMPRGNSQLAFYLPTVFSASNSLVIKGFYGTTIARFQAPRFLWGSF